MVSPFVSYKRKNIFVGSHTEIVQSTLKSMQARQTKKGKPRKPSQPESRKPAEGKLIYKKPLKHIPCFLQYIYKIHKQYKQTYHPLSCAAGMANFFHIDINEPTGSWHGDLRLVQVCPGLPNNIPMLSKVVLQSKGSTKGGPEVAVFKSQCPEVQRFHHRTEVLSLHYPKVQRLLSSNPKVQKSKGSTTGLRYYPCIIPRSRGCCHLIEAQRFTIGLRYYPCIIPRSRGCCHLIPRSRGSKVHYRTEVLSLHYPKVQRSKGSTTGPGYYPYVIPRSRGCCHLIPRSRGSKVHYRTEVLSLHYPKVQRSKGSTTGPGYYPYVIPRSRGPKVQLQDRGIIPTLSQGPEVAVI